jgi:hypothetical protein
MQVTDSTPWVAGSNPAGIAHDFNEMRVLFLEIRVALCIEENPLISGFPV